MGDRQHDSSDSVVGEWLVPGSAGPEPVVLVPVDALSVAGSPRIAGSSADHVQVLTEAPEELPPIIVHRDTMRVIDGVHRLHAARLRQQEQIAVRFFSGDADDAFVIAVKANIEHGLPLSLAEREAAAARIVQSHGQWSDRMIASVSGLSPRTIGQIRARQDGKPSQAAGRIGQDGRVRPVDGPARRLLAAQLISADPGLSLREVARAAGISPETARDVRNRLLHGEDPVARRAGPGAAQDSGRVGGTGQPLDKPPAGFELSRASAENLALIVERLKADPAIRFTETGRALLRLLHVHLIEVKDWDRIGESVPVHWSTIIAQLAKGCAQMWAELADHAERKVTDSTE
jgi:DNA-binding NarL/FixJ family response regulator